MAANQQSTATEVCFLGREAIELDADRSIEVIFLIHVADAILST